MPLFSKKPKSELHDAVAYAKKAIFIAYQYERDEHYIPSATELTLFRQLSDTLWANHATAAYIADSMQQRMNKRSVSAKPLRSSFALLMAVFMLSACTTPLTTLKNDRTGEVVTCGGGTAGFLAGGLIGYHIQKSNDLDCVTQYLDQGYRKVKTERFD